MKDTAARNTELRQMLTEAKRVLQAEVHSHLRDGRSEASNDVRDDIEHSDARMQGDIELALIQMKANTLARIEQAIVRLDAGKYGWCSECDSEISERRLRAMPFALRCQSCEGHREQEQGQARRLAQRRDSGALFSDVIRP
jgi:DnaK suppressor protein